MSKKEEHIVLPLGHTQSSPVQGGTELQTAKERFVTRGDLTVAEPTVGLAASLFDGLGDSDAPTPALGGLFDEEIGDGEARPRTRKQKAHRAESQLPTPFVSPPPAGKVQTGDDLNGLLLVMLLEMQEYWGGMIRPEVALYLAQQLSKRSGNRFHGMNTTSMAEKVREFVEKRHWLEAHTHGYTLTPRGRTIARLCQRKQGVKSSGEVCVTVRVAANNP